MKKPATDADSADYRELSAELATVIDKLEDGEIDIDAAVSCYERGLEIVNLLETRLLRAENRVAELKHELASPDESTSEEE